MSQENVEIIGAYEAFRAGSDSREAGACSA